jgi:hypothetical protein
MTDYLENKIIDQLFRAQAYSFPATLYFALFIASRGYSSNIRSTAVSLLDTVIPTAPNGRMYRCTTAGTTASGEPTWPTTSGGTVADGTAVWTEMTPDFEAKTNLIEVTGTGYARVSQAASLANFAGTQGAGTTTASSGTSGTTSNNNALTYGSPTANWGLVAAIGVFDAASAGNMLSYGLLTTPKSVNNGDAAPNFAAAAFTYQIDN